MALIVALVLLAIYVANVVTGAITSGPLFGNVTEMLVLFCAAIAFTVGILKREAAAERTKQPKQD